jgi:hypothetical protein
VGAGAGTDIVDVLSLVSFSNCVKDEGVGFGLTADIAVFWVGRQVTPYSFAVAHWDAFAFGK